MLRPWLAVLLSVVAPAAGRAAAENPPLAAFARAEVAPSKTSIYVGRVSLTMPAFVRHGGTYESSYAANVFPYFFFNEAGRLHIEVSDDQLRTLARGEAIDFKGRGVRSDGTERPIEGKATPTDAQGGRLKVRVFVSTRTQLIFNTTYRWAGK